MTRRQLPKNITSPLTGDNLALQELEDHNDCVISAAQFFDDSTECFDPYLALYVNKSTGEGIYIPYEESPKIYSPYDL